MASGDRRILFFGDSHVLGVRDPRFLGWPGRLALAATAAGLPITLYNLGVRGQTTREVADRWPAEAAMRMKPGWDCGLVFSSGVNDTMVVDGSVRLAPGEAVAALEEIAGRARLERVPLFVVGPAPVAEQAHTERVADLSQRFAAVCAQLGIPFVPVVERLREEPAWMAEVAADDGAHPAGKGYDLIADAVLAGGWIEWLRGSAPTDLSPVGDRASSKT